MTDSKLDEIFWQFADKHWSQYFDKLSVEVSFGMKDKDIEDMIEYALKCEYIEKLDNSERYLIK